MSGAKKMVPKRRFKEFLNAGDWEQRKLDEVCNVYDGTHQTPRYTNSGVMFVSVEDIETLESNKYITEEDFKSEFKVFPEYGDILLTRIGDVGSANVILDEIKRAYYVSLALLKPKNINSLFLLALLGSSSVQSEIWRRTLHIAFPKKINKNEINKVIVKQPSIPEQEKIGKLFFSLDQTITLHQRKLDKLQATKKALLQEMFPEEGQDKPKRRFKGFTDAWEQRKLSDILKVNSGKDYKHLDQGDIPVYGTGGYMLSVNESLSNIDAIGIGRKGTIDKPQYLKAPFWTVDTLFYLTALDKHSILFLYYLMQLIPWKKFDESTGVPSLSKTTIDNISGFVPSNSQEEELISALFNQLDKSITLHQRKLDKLKNLKQAYLNEMFV